MKKNGRSVLVGAALFVAIAAVLAAVLPEVSQTVLIGVAALLIAAAGGARCRPWHELLRGKG